MIPWRNLRPIMNRSICMIWTTIELDWPTHGRLCDVEFGLRPGISVIFLSFWESQPIATLCDPNGHAHGIARHGHGLHLHVYRDNCLPAARKVYRTQAFDWAPLRGPLRSCCLTWKPMAHSPKHSLPSVVRPLPVYTVYMCPEALGHVFSGSVYNLLRPVLSPLRFQSFHSFTTVTIPAIYSMSDTNNAPKVVLHHLANSRSQRILWLLVSIPSSFPRRQVAYRSLRPSGRAIYSA